jgi:lipoprotein LprG
MRMPARPLALLAAGALLVLTGCTEDAAPAEGESPEDVLAQAKQVLDDTSGIRLSLDADELPPGVSAVSGAEGVGTHAPAFDGTLDVVLAGSEFEVPVIAVDGTVYAQVPLVPGWQDVDPAEYGAPDPAQLMSTDAGFSSLLPATEGVEQGESVRGGENNEEVLTEYTGTVPGEVVGNVIPSASGEFDATYTITDGGELRTVVLTGVFYPGTSPMTYTIAISDYGSEPSISAP